MENENLAEPVQPAPEKKKKLFIPIGVKMITITSLIVIGSLAGVAIAASYFFRGDNEVRAMEDTLRYSSLIAKKVKSDISSVVEKSKLAASGIRQGGGKKKKKSSGDEGESFSDALFKRDPDILYIGLMTKGGADSIRSIKNNKAAANIDYGKAIRAEMKTISRSFKNEETLFNASAYLGEPVSGIAVPYGTVDGDDTVMIVFFSMEKLLEAIRTQGIIKSFIVSGSGDVIAHFDSTVARSKANLANLPIVKLMMKNPNPNGQTFYKDEKGARHLGAFQRAGFSDAAVISTVPEDIAFAAVYKIQKIIAYITIIGLSLAIILIFLFSKTITRPIQRLVDAANTIQRGDFTITVPAESSDEIGRLSSSFTDMAKGLAEREKMKDAFGKFVNKEVAELVLKGELKLGGERKNVAVFFSDIRSFTAISEKLEPEEVVEFLNEYMSLMVDCVEQSRGVVDKFIGDAIMAIWGAPLSHGNDTENAVNGALMMRTALMKFNEGRGGEKKPVIKIGSGINYGPVLVGQIGSQQRMEYTVIGDAVNLASRIESLNKPFGTDILISSDAYEIVKDSFAVAPMKKIKVKGKSEPQQIYAVLGRLDDADAPKSLAEMRTLVGIDFEESAEKEDASGEDDDKEVKYEIIE